MTCYHPLSGWKARRIDPTTGRRAITFQRVEAFLDLPVSVACGRCIGCRLDKARDWAIRCEHEASLHLHNSFLTLTYDDEHLPSDGNLNIVHLQQFYKRLRRAGHKVRYLAVGEYGGATWRPHYHAIVFGYWPRDARFWKTGGAGDTIYTSESLDAIWQQGRAFVGTCTEKSAGYVARYSLKKVGTQDGPPADSLDVSTGELVRRVPEFLVASKRPAIGKEYFLRYRSDMIPLCVDVADIDEIAPRINFTRADGTTAPVPKYYLEQERLLREADYNRIKLSRLRASKAPKAKADRTPERLAVREEVKRAAIKSLKRD